MVLGCTQVSQLVKWELMQFIAAYCRENNITDEQKKKVCEVINKEKNPCNIAKIIEQCWPGFKEAQRVLIESDGLRLKTQYCMEICEKKCDYATTLMPQVSNTCQRDYGFEFLR